MRSSTDKVPEAVVMVEIIQGKSLVEYTGDEDEKFLKITVALPHLIATTKRLLENGFYKNNSLSPFEANIDIDLRYGYNLIG